MAQSAEELLHSNKYREAAVKFRDLLHLDPHYREAYFSLGVCYSETGDFAQAEASLRKYLSLEPLSSDGHTALGLVLARTGRTVEAQKEFGQALKLDSSQDVARLELARLDLVSQDYEHTVSLLRPWIQAHPDAFDALTVKAEAEMALRDYAHAITSIQQVLSSAPGKYQDLYIMLGDCWKLLGEADKAAEVYERGLAAFPNWQPLQERYLSVLRESGRLSAVVNERLQMLKMTPNDVAQLITMGSLLTGSDDKTEPPTEEVAGTLLGQALKLAPQNASAHYNYCRLMTRLRTLDKAVNECQMALNLTADDQLKIMTYSLLGQIEEERSHPDAAEAPYRSAAELNRKSGVHDLSASYHFIHYLTESARYEEARAITDEALSWAPISPGLLMERAQLQARVGKLQQATETAELALAHTGEDKEIERSAHVFLAKTYFRMNMKRSSALAGRSVNVNLHDALYPHQIPRLIAPIFGSAPDFQPLWMGMRKSRAEACT